MDRPALPKEDLFDTSTMTFGEHLEELRRSLVRAIAWLIAGGLIALLFLAEPVVNGIQTPLKAAIVDYKADRSLAKLGYNPESEQVKESPLRAWMMEHGMAWELVYVLPPESIRGSLQEALLPQGDASSEANDSSEATQRASDKQGDSGKQAVSGEQKDAAGGKVVTDTKASAKEGTDKTEPGVKDKKAEQEPVALADPKTKEELLEGLPSPSEFLPQLQLRMVEAGLNSHQVEEPFMIYLKASILIGAVVASPGIFFHIWQFVAAGLYPHERKYVYLYLPFSIGLFVGGVCLAFFAVMKYVLDFLLDFNSSLSVDMEPRLSYYMSFVMLLPLGFGIAFQLPLVMLFLQRIGLIETSAYEKSWRIAVLVIAFLSMILTPADPYSMILLMIPLIFLYFLGIGLCKFMPRGRGLGSQAYDPV